jgi:hypothetical protein
VMIKLSDFFFFSVIFQLKQFCERIQTCGSIFFRGEKAFDRRKWYLDMRIPAGLFV